MLGNTPKNLTSISTEVIGDGKQNFGKDIKEGIVGQTNGILDESHQDKKEAVTVFENRELVLDESDETFKIEEETFKVDSDNWEKIKLIENSPLVKMNTEGDIIEFVEGRNAGEQLFTRKAALRELKKQGKKLPNLDSLKMFLNGKEKEILGEIDKIRSEELDGEIKQEFLGTAPGYVVRYENTGEWNYLEFSDRTLFLYDSNDLKEEIGLSYIDMECSFIHVINRKDSGEKRFYSVYPVS